ncbi:MAG: SDR family oxidoreductase [Nanoarchaeota archaeon]|nr:SDR family oxidoreductase [DPANN group archaeon]MBL7117022.1 SDR family oxidoreductase [Nanoarchaeota archaeon]
MLYIQRKKEIIEKTLVKRLGSPKDIAKTILYLLDSDFVTGQVIVVDGGSSVN